MHLCIAEAVLAFCVILSGAKSDNVHPSRAVLPSYLANLSADEHSCPPWFFDDDGRCVCGSEVWEIVKCDNRTKSAQLLPGYCMTYTNGIGVVGNCLLGYVLNHHSQLYMNIPSTVAQLNNMVCGRFNRAGQLCGRCADGYSVPAYSYDWTCIPCKGSNWVKYIAVAFLPLTLFFVVIFAFRINATSAQFHSFVLFCQLTTFPSLIRNTVVETKLFSSLPVKWIYYVGYYGLLTLYGVWNLDFFRLIYEPFCLYPNMTTLEAVTLEYLTAVYPLALCLILYLLVKLYDYRLRAIEWLLKPVRCFMERFTRKLDLRMSLVDAFITFYVLSFMKIVNITIDIMLPVHPIDVHGEYLHHRYWFYDANLEYFGDTHKPYFILAVAVAVVFVVFPGLMFIFYQFKCTPRRGFCHFIIGNSLHMFMDAIQGGYKNGTDGTRDCRYFPIVYLILRIFLVVVYARTFTVTFYYLATLMIIASAMLVIVISPYKSNFFNKFDTIILLFLAAFTVVIAFSFEVYLENSKTYRRVVYLLLLVIGLVPLVYIFGYMVYWITGRGRLLRVIANKLKLRKEITCDQLDTSLPHRLTHPQEYTPLLMQGSATDE